jgi:hypothetical protein
MKVDNANEQQEMSMLLATGSGVYSLEESPTISWIPRGAIDTRLGASSSPTRIKKGFHMCV